MATDQKLQPVIFYSSPGSLQGIAASNIAFHLWRHQVGNLHLGEDIENYQVCIDDNTLPLPRPIIDQINILIKPVGFKFTKWWNFHNILYSDSDCSPQIYSLRTECLNRIICKSNNSHVNICYTKTAENLLNSDKLSLEQKYKLACMYCLNDHVEKLWPLVLNSKEIHSNDARLMNENSSDHMFTSSSSLHSEYNIEVVNLLSGINQASSHHFVEAALLRVNNLYPQIKVEYFCAVQRSQDAIEHIITMYLHRTGLPGNEYYLPEIGRFRLEHYEVIKYLLPKLNIVYLKRILRKYPIRLIMYFAREEENYPYVLQLWNYMKDSITEKQFFIVIFKLWQMAFVSDYCIYNRHVASLLCDLFMAASQEFRNYLVSRHVEFFFALLPAYHEREDMTKYGFNVEFIFELLKITNSELRKKLCCNNWYKLILLMNATNLDKLLKLCYGDDQNKILQCKRDLMLNCSINIPGIYSLFVNNGFYFELISFLRCIIPSDEERLEEMKCIVNRNLGKIMKMNSNALVRFNVLIDVTFESKSLAQDFKEDFITKNIDLWCDWLKRGELKGVKNIIDCFVSSELFKFRLKEIFYEYYQDILGSGDFFKCNVQECDEFLRWCAPSQIELDSFKKFLDIVEIFEQFVAELKLLQMENNGMLPRYNDQKYKNFLKWYFVCDNVRKNFVDVMLNYLREEDDLFKSVLKRYFY